MKHYILALFLCLSTSVIAEEHRRFNVTCDSTEVLITALKEQYKEIPVAVGISRDSVNSITSIWMNPETNSFTILQSHKDMSCVIVIGSDFEISTEVVQKGTPI